MNEHAKNVREVAVLRNGPDQSILIPKEFEFSSDTVLMTQDANGTIHIRSKEPKAPRKSIAELIEWLKQQEPIEEEFEVPDDRDLLPLKEIDL
jgi:virulence-associated protein VagC